MRRNNMENEKKVKLTPVVWIAAAITALLVLYGAFFSENFSNVTSVIQSFITINFSWYYVSITTVMILFCLLFVFTPMGQIRLGKPTERPEFRTVSWLGMLFMQGLGIDAVCV